MSITPTRFQVWYQLSCVRIFQEEVPSRLQSACSLPTGGVFGPQTRSQLRFDAGVHSCPTNTVAGAGDHPGKMHVLPGARRARSRQLGRARVRASSAPPGTGDAKQGLPDRCVGCSDACHPALDPSWLPGSISGRGGSMRRSSVHPIVSVFDELYVAQDKQHLTKQMADCVRNL